MEKFLDKLAYGFAMTCAGVLVLLAAGFILVAGVAVFSYLFDMLVW